MVSYLTKLLSLLSLTFLVACTPNSFAGTWPTSVGGKNLPSLAPMLKKVTPSVVNITTEGTQKINEALLNDPFFKRFIGSNIAKERPVDGTGSGIIINSKHGYILTNYHVIEEATKINVTLNDGRQYEAEIVGIDPRADMAIIRIDASNLKAIRFGNSNNIQVGDFVVAIGNPYGIGQSVSSGIISALHRNPGIGEYENFIQTDASINLGSSGGALINLRGELIGVNTAILGGQSGGSVGIGFAIPANTAAGVINQIIRYGNVSRGELGVEVRNISAPLAKQEGLRATEGALISQVFSPSAAADAGLIVGDIIISINEQPVFGASAVKNIIGNLRAGTPLNIVYVRNKQEYLVNTVLRQPASVPNNKKQ